MPHEYRRNGWWRDHTFLDDLRRTAHAHPRKTAVAVRRDGHPTHALDYAELAHLTERCAAALTELGVHPGDTVAVQLTDRWELPVIALACLRAGARICPLLPVYRRRELQTMLTLTEPRVLITMAEHDGDPLAALATELAAAIPAIAHVAVADGAPEGTLPFEDHFFATPWEERHDTTGRALTADDPYLILFTSGTTGEPKGVLHTPNTLYAAIRGEADVFALDDTLVMTTTSAYTHYTGFAQGMLMPLMLGGTMVFSDTHDGPAVLDLLADHHVTFLYAAPHFVAGMLRTGHHRDLPALRHLVSGSAPIPPAFVDDVADRFGLRLHSLWGMSENGPVTITRPADPPGWAAHSDGSPIPGMRLRIDPIPGQPEGVGRLWVRGPAQCLGYYRRDHLYAAALDDGWFDTGDLARPDGRDGIRITGRAGDSILRKGWIVPVAELEDLLDRHPHVREATVIGVPEGQGEDETICAVIAAATTLTLEDLRDHLRAAGMTTTYWPERLELLDTLPRTVTGKVRKTELRQRLTTSPDGP
ncbi:AMP-binding protein [Actinomadura sp. DC4]|uniref:AMP-binding protein n=1 Tax=Actinomadura sp. DC4 TaxID=3055069 RepID=UPI0025AFB8BA|nr:AMP-binding protein [Actinomadura sp. DC4]MDN3356279.1 AMP-binding protein [Actinomadura sp. DC4]